MILQFLSELSITPLILLVICFLTVLYYSRTSKSNLPPGPLPIPLLGNLYLLIGGRDQREIFSELRQKYGDVFTFYLGHKPVVVVCGYNLIKEVFQTHGGVFSGRPKGSFVLELAGNKGIVGTEGKIWKEQRRFTLSTLRDFGMGRNLLQVKILEESAKLEEELLKIAKSGQSLNPQDLMYTSVSNIVNSMIFGKRFEYEDEEFLVMKRALVENMRLTSSVGIFDIFPILRYLPGDLFHAKKMLSNAEIVHGGIRRLVNEHLISYNENEIRDFVDAYIKEMRVRENDPDTTFDELQLCHVATDMFVAGTETTSTTISWILLYLITYPDVQNRIWKEIQENIRVDRRPVMSDRTSLPYLEATIMEVLRHCDLGPINLPHCALEDATIRTHSVPKGTMVTAFMHTVSYGEDLWGDPENFRPSRFLDENGHLTLPEHAIFFFLGKRVCVGESLAKMNLFLFIASIIQKFEILPANENVIPSLKGVFGFTNSPLPYEFRLKLRS